MPDVRMPDGTIIRNVPEGTTKDELMRRYQAAKPTSFWQGVAEGVQKPATNALRTLAKTNPVLNVLSAAADLGIAPKAASARNVASSMDRQADAAKLRSRYQGSTLGNVAGSVAGTAPTAFLPGGVFAQGAAGGAMMSESDDPLTIAKNALIGGVMGKVGQQAGKRVVAPIAERIGRTAPARAASRVVTSQINRLLPGAAQQLPLPKFSQADRAVTRMHPDLAEARQLAADAARLKLPVALADTDPRLRDLAGSAARYSPEVMAAASRSLDARARGQASRAVEGIDRHLAPITDIEARSAQIMERGKPVYDPLYERAYAGPTVTSPKIESILQTPAGREATGKANTIAANEFRNPQELGFALDDVGNVVLNPQPNDAIARHLFARDELTAAQEAYRAARSSPTADLAGARDRLLAARDELRRTQQALEAAPDPTAAANVPGYTPQSLDYVKGGMDDMLEPYRNEITGRLDLDRNGRAINAMKNQLLSELDTLNPDYKAARAAYGQYAKQAEALTTGQKLLPATNTPQRNFDRILGRARAYDDSLEDASLALVPEMQRGYATHMADTVNRQRLSQNPYEAVYGGTDQQAKVAALFPEGADDFGRQYEIERQMAATRNEVLGGSQTQPRAIADDLFKNDIGGGAADIALDMATGGGGLKGAARIAARKVRDRQRLGITGAQKRANEIGPVLLDTSNPAGVQNYLDELSRKLMEQESRRQAYQRLGGLFGSAAGAGVGLSLLPR